MFLIKGGRVKLSKVLEDGTEQTLDICKAGDFVGENMFSEEGRGYPVSAYCLEDTLTCGFSRSQFEGACFAVPEDWLTDYRKSKRENFVVDRTCGVARPLPKYRRPPLPSAHQCREKSMGQTVLKEFLFNSLQLGEESSSFLTGAHRVSISRTMKALKRSGENHPAWKNPYSALRSGMDVIRTAPTTKSFILSSLVFSRFHFSVL